MNRRAKYDAATFILGGEIRNRIQTHTHTHLVFVRDPAFNHLVQCRLVTDRQTDVRTDTINLNAPSRLLRSSSHNLLHVPFTTTAIGRKAFSFAAPTVWNSIPLSIRQSPSIGSFKRHLKTHLFTLPD